MSRNQGFGFPAGGRRPVCYAAGRLNAYGSSLPSGRTILAGDSGGGSDDN